jgi:hypothetical protein
VSTLEARFWAKVAKSDGCWEWTGSTSRGYGKIGIGHTKTISAHRASYEMHLGEIPAGLVVCHRCDNKRCVRPDHLFLGTQADNMADMRAKGRGSKPPRHTNFVRGEASGRAKLTDDDVRTIRAGHADGATRRELSLRFGVGKSTIEAICVGRTWRHVA